MKLLWVFCLLPAAVSSLSTGRAAFVRGVAAAGAGVVGMGAAGTKVLADPGDAYLVRRGATVTFQGGVTAASAFQLRVALEEAADEDSEFVVLNVTSGGGSLMDAVGVTETIKGLRKRVVSQVVGYAASAASLITASAAVRVLPPRSSMLVHQSRTSLEGSEDALWHGMDHLNHWSSVMRDVYIDNSRGKLDEATLDALLREEQWLRYQQAYVYGLCDLTEMPSSLP